MRASGKKEKPRPNSTYGLLHSIARASDPQRLARLEPRRGVLGSLCQIIMLVTVQSRDGTNFAVPRHLPLAVAWSPRKLLSHLHMTDRLNARDVAGKREAASRASTEGKARSARNAVTYGLNSQPGEPTKAYRETLTEWIGALKPKGIVERALAERARRAA